MWLSDSSSVYAKGAYLELPASAGTPYILSADGKKLAGSDDGALWLYFLDSQKNSLYGTRARISSTDWDNYSVAAIAPDGTCYVKVLLYSSTIATGTSMFKGVELKEDYTEFYVSSGGTGTGTSYSDPALYTSSSFWSDVDDEAGSHPVKVVFKSGSYTSDNLIIQNMGDADNRIILEGEKPFETLFDGLYGIRFYGSQNMIVSNIHFCSSNAATARIAVGQSGVETKDITIDNCNFVDLTDVVYGVCSVAQAGTHDVTIDKCIFVRVGDDNDGSHMIYNSHDSYDINICNNYFEDGWGTYVKIRSGSSGYNISGNTFIQNNGYRTSSSKPFIHFSAINTGTTDEVLGTNYLIEDNYFEYNSYSHYPFWIYVVGDTPVNHPGYHEITVSEKNVIQSTAYSDSVRNSEILDNFGVDIVSDWSINNNTYYNASSVKFILGLTDPPAGFEAVSADIFSLID
jgi:hypothetical protein